MSAGDRLPEIAPTNQYSDIVVIDETPAQGLKQAGRVVQVVGTVPLPTGAATAAKQDTGNTSLGTLVTQTDGLEASASSIDTKLSSQATAAKQDTGNAVLTNFGAGEYETVAASQTAQVLGGSGAIGDYISGVLVIPATLDPGNIILLDNAISITIFTGGTGSVLSLIPFFIPLGIKSVSGAWKCTTGSSVSVLASGNFT